MSPNNESIENTLSSNLAEAGLTVVKVAAGAGIAAFGAPPGTDGVAVALIDSIFRPMIGQRYAKFATSVIQRIEALEINFQSIARDNEHIATVYIQAAREAAMAHEQEKIDALRNAVVNAAVGIDIESEI